MQLKIEFLRGCTEQKFMDLLINNHPEALSVSIAYYNWGKGKVNRFKLSKDSFFTAINQFETACADQRACGGFGGGTGVYIEKHFNNKLTKFNYCQDGPDAWSGLEYFFGLMGKKLEDYSFK